MARKNQVVAINNASLRDIAQIADVSVSTVSKAMARQNGVSLKKATYIREIAERIGYKPNPFRRNIKRAIGFVATWYPNDEYVKNLVFATQRISSENNFHLQVEFIDQNDSSKVWPDVLAENRVDGIILVGFHTPKLYERIKAEKVPAVAINDTLERTGCCCVVNNQSSATADGVTRLLSLGHRHVAMVTTDCEYLTVRQRYQAYCFALFDAGINPEQDWVVNKVPANYSGGQEAVRKLHEKGTMPTAIVFTNDLQAIGGMIELFRLGYKIPEDVSIIGHDNLPLCTEISPNLTSTDMCMDTLGNEAMALLLKQINKKIDKPVENIISSNIVWRETCGPPRKS